MRGVSRPHTQTLYRYLNCNVISNKCLIVYVVLHFINGRFLKYNKVSFTKFPQYSRVNYYFFYFFLLTVTITWVFCGQMFHRDQIIELSNTGCRCNVVKIFIFKLVHTTSVIRFWNLYTFIFIK